MVKRIAYKKRVIIASAVIAGVLLAGGVAYFIYTKQQSAMVENDTDKKSTAHLADDQIEFSQQDYLKLSAEVERLLAAGDREKALRLLSSRYEAETNVDKKVKMISQESAILGENGLVDEALDAALKADQIKSTPSTLMQVAMAYSLKKDTNQQVEYIKKAIVAIDADESIDAELKVSMKAGYQRSIEAVESEVSK
jgi:phosphate/sulfate permease